MSHSTLHRLKHNMDISTKTVNDLCRILNCRIQDIADYIGVDRTYLYKIFMREAQISPKQYLLQYRIRAAAKLLQTQDYTVTEIAYSCGFRDSAAFCYHFRQQIGMTPRQYREKIRSGTY